MYKNIGVTDQKIRYILGIVLLTTGVFIPGNARWVMLGLGAVIFLTAQFQFCTLYTLLGYSSHPKMK